MTTATVPINLSQESESADRMYSLMERLYPICRSITGNGVRESLHILSEQIPLQIREVPTGKKVFDWTVPREWNVREAYVSNSLGERVIDFKAQNLHLMSYSVPVCERMSLSSLREHIHTLPDQPGAIPYRTSYYAPEWGFCLSQNALDSLDEDLYDVVIDSTLSDGSLSYGELFIPGTVTDEVLISVHCCHPSMCNDNLSGIVVATELARRLCAQDNRFSYRFLFVPGTIGSITWLAQNEERLARIRHGMVLSCLGDDGAFTYKKSRGGTNTIDRVFAAALRDCEYPFSTRPFMPYGYDERQYCSPGINLPVGVLSRTPYGEFPEYHTSADDLTLVKPMRLAESLRVCERACSILEANRSYLNTNPKCEPQLGRRGLYATMGGSKTTPNARLALLWVLNQSDGEHSLLDISESAELSFSEIEAAAGMLRNHDLLSGGSTCR